MVYITVILLEIFIVNLKIFIYSNDILGVNFNVAIKYIKIYILSIPYDNYKFDLCS